MRPTTRNMKETTPRLITTNCSKHDEPHRGPEEKVTLYKKGTEAFLETAQPRTQWRTSMNYWKRKLPIQNSTPRENFFSRIDEQDRRSWTYLSSSSCHVRQRRGAPQAEGNGARWKHGSNRERRARKPRWDAGTHTPHVQTACGCLHTTAAEQGGGDRLCMAKPRVFTIRLFMDILGLHFRHN